MQIDMLKNKMLTRLADTVQRALSIAGMSSKGISPYEHSGNPLLRYYIEYRQSVIGTSLKLQSAVAIFVAVGLASLESRLTLRLGQYALLLSILGIPLLSFWVNARLISFVRQGWKERYPRLDYSGVWGYYGNFSNSFAMSRAVRE